MLGAIEAKLEARNPGILPVGIPASHCCDNRHRFDAPGNTGHQGYGVALEELKRISRPGIRKGLEYDQRIRVLPPAPVRAELGLGVAIPHESAHGRINAHEAGVIDPRSVN